MHYLTLSVNTGDHTTSCYVHFPSVGIPLCHKNLLEWPDPACWWCNTSSAVEGVVWSMRLARLMIIWRGDPRRKIYVSRHAMEDWSHQYSSLWVQKYKLCSWLSVLQLSWSIHVCIFYMYIYVDHIWMTSTTTPTKLIHVSSKFSWVHYYINEAGATMATIFFLTLS